MAMRQSYSAISGGSSSPASMPPIGVPVCLIEKTSGCHGGGACRDRICELAGFSIPVPRPISSAATRAIGQTGTAAVSISPATPPSKAA